MLCPHCFQSQMGDEHHVSGQGQRLGLPCRRSGSIQPKSVGWSISESLATPLVNEALKKAIESRRPNTEQLLHYSDRGCQYTSDEYHRVLKTMSITCSMSGTGCCYDNAVIERFF